ncbi:two-component system, chemotaxis family, sensor kinase CheA [Tindallia magadiensis]|uniref:Stage 0 sporulation protein A homolog n=1 Tax=Tindallia magadiensis TaxID=69895 RepID=A0A1I3APF4_9FIRM|nr:chemotaxis protein CheW [Tindallia magadiensis]SFH51676.1 two-component system, chemotaxis family, sensor kinase CheA [Tindallia magadiensis]
MIHNEEFINEFVEEAETHLQMVENGLLAMDEGSRDKENINNVFRSIHSIKGTAGFFGLEKIVELAHVMENILGELRNDKIEPTAEMVDLLLNGNDSLKEMVDDVFNSAGYDVDDLINNMTNILKGENVCDVSSKDEIITSVDTQELVTKISKAQLEQIEQAKKHGHYLYKVKIGINRDIGAKEISPVLFFKKIQSVGEIVDSYTDISDVESIDSVMDSDVYFSFVFTTVLEKNLLPIALDIDSDSVEELDFGEALNKEIQSSEKLEKSKSVNSSETTDDKEDALVINTGDTIVSDHETDVILDNNENNEVSDLILKKSSTTAVVEDSVRVHVSLLNDLLNLASEMVLGRNQLLRNIEEYRKSIVGLDAILQNIDRVTTELQEKIMQTRMQPVGNVFNKMPRVIRDLSKKLGKEVDLNIEGSHVELDKSIIESLSDPLTHLIRNAVDHGLETPDQRKKVNKSTVGQVDLKAYHESGYVHIDIIDDGAGIDSERIKKKAIDKGLINEVDLKNMNEQEILQLLMMPGFSTADQITDVSGRGVGMDVVKTNIEKLGGTIEIKTILGEGTTFRMILPLTLAIIPSLIVEVSQFKFALPQVNLQEMVRLKEGDESKKIEYVHNAQVLRLRGKLLPIVDLGEVLGLRSFKEKEVNKEFDGITRILVLKVGSKRFGLVVDSIYDEEEILVKPLPKYFKNCQCYSGVTIMGDGKTAMILDPEGIVNKASLRFMDEQVKASEAEVDDQLNELKELQNMLIFKCSGDETFGIDLSLVSRVEEITKNDIDKVGNKEYIQYRGDALRVVRPENYLPVSKKDHSPEKLYVIIPKLVKNPIGIIIEKIHDTMMTSIHLNQEDIKGRGLLGSTILNNKIVLLVNIYELFEMVSPEEYENESLKNRSGEKTILLAEDTPFFARLTKNYLEWAGYNVLLTENGEQALEVLKEKPVDLVLSDIQMPVMDGLDLVRSIRKNAKLNELPVIALTSMTSDKDKQLGMQAGFDYYEFKLDKASILYTLKKALSKEVK